MNDTATLARGNPSSLLSSDTNDIDFPDSAKVPPHDLEAERALLGAMILDPSVIAPVWAIIKDAAAFHSPRHRIIAMAVHDMSEQGIALDAVTLRDHLDRSGQLNEVNVQHVLMDLMEAVPHAENSEYYARIVRKKYELRRVGAFGKDLFSKSMTRGAVSSELLSWFESSFASLNEGRTSSRSFTGLDVAELATYATQEPEWLVQGIFTTDELLLVGARSKGCKTLQLVDLAVALASGTPWLSRFVVSKQFRTLFISGETNDRRMSQNIAHACRVRNQSMNDLSGMLRVESNAFPTLPSPDDLRSIARTVREYNFDVVILDPLYRGMSGVDASRLNDMGTVIKNFQAACSPATLILSHHVVKNAAREYGSPPSLEDMTGAGIAESCGQWWLVGRNQRYGWDCMHDLCVSYGGREGQAGGKRIVFNEQAWTFSVEDLNDFIAKSDKTRQREKDTAKANAEERKVKQASEKILAACRNVKTPQSKTFIRDSSGQSGATFLSAFAKLLKEEKLLPRPYRDSQNRFKTEGFIMSEYAPDYERLWEAS